APGRRGADQLPGLDPGGHYRPARAQEGPAVMTELAAVEVSEQLGHITEDAASGRMAPAEANKRSRAVDDALPCGAVAVVPNPGSCNPLPVASAPGPSAQKRHRGEGRLFQRG